MSVHDQSVLSAWYPFGCTDSWNSSHKSRCGNLDGAKPEFHGDRWLCLGVLFACIDGIEEGPGLRGMG